MRAALPRGFYLIRSQLNWGVRRTGEQREASMREQDFKSLTGWVDYDRPHLPGLTKSQEIRYFQRRLKTSFISNRRAVG